MKNTITHSTTIENQRVLRVRGVLWVSGKIITYDYNLPSAARLFKTLKDVRQIVGGEFMDIYEATVIDKVINTSEVQQVIEIN